MHHALTEIRKKMKTNDDRQVIDKALRMVAAKDLITDEDIMNEAFQRMLRTTDSNNPSERKIRDAFLFLGTIGSVLEPIQKYLSHEADVIRAAKVACPESERGNLSSAERELQARMDKFTAAIRNPRKLYQLLTNPDEAKKMVEFDFYKK